MIIRKIKDRRFRGVDVELDNMVFERCTFDCCVFVWNGGEYLIKDSSIINCAGFNTYDTKIAQTIDFLKHVGLLRDDFGTTWKMRSKADIIV